MTPHLIRLPMRDGVRLATDLYLPRQTPAPVVVVRTPYGRRRPDRGFPQTLLAFVERGWAVISQDCRGTGDSEPDSWDFYVWEAQDGVDLVEWIAAQAWCDGFIASFGASYVGQTQWGMALHPAMSAIAPAVSGLGVAVNTARLHLFVNAYARAVGKGEGRAAIPTNQMEKVFERETMEGGWFDEPFEPPRPGLWDRYCALDAAGRAGMIRALTGSPHVGIAELEPLQAVFGQRISADAHTIPAPTPRDLPALIRAPALLQTGWYDWGLNDALATFDLLRQGGSQPADRSRLVISPRAHSAPGYREGAEDHPELLRPADHRDELDLLLRWYAAVRADAIEAWPAVTYYLMGANAWRTAQAWPPPEAREQRLWLAAEGRLSPQPPVEAEASDRYRYDPHDPTPTVGGSIVSYLYTPGGVDVAGAQQRPDVLTYTSGALDADIDVVGPLRMVLWAQSSAIDTDFAVRLSDVFPDGRAIQLQNGVLRARHRDLDAGPQPLEPGKPYRLEVDMWATANRFRRGHRIRIDISSADFPRFDRQALPADQASFRDSGRPSHFVFFAVEPNGISPASPHTVA